MIPKPESAQVPGPLADVALVAAPTIAAAADISVSYWHELVRSKKAPQPVVRRHRFTRWTVASVHKWLEDRAREGTSEAASNLIDRATKASAAAQVARRRKNVQV